MTRKILILVALASMTLTGCSAIQSVTSDAYALGLATGQEYAELKETTDNLQSWIPEEDGTESEPIFEGDEDSVREYCAGIWVVVGITSGLENSDTNESDFVSGCLDGAGF
jgi:predicted small secreted protein